MSCVSNQNKPDWKAYTLGELDAEKRREAEVHAAACSECRDELASVRLTLDALSSLREEEMPRRIAFVSDKVFEPRWWQAFLRPSFAGACVIALAILAHGFMRSSQGIDQAKLQAAVDTAVVQAVAVSDKRHEQEKQEMLAAYEMFYKQVTRMYAVNTGLTVRQ
jgi:anti-sigma factor RsiW